MHFDNKVVPVVRTDIPTQRVASYTSVHGWRRHLVRKYRPLRRPHCIGRVPSAPRKGHSTPPPLGPCLLWPRSPISATAELLFHKILCCAPCPQHNIFWTNNVLWQVCHNRLLFESQHIIFSKDIVLCAMSATQYLCCESKSNVLWQTCHNTSFLKILCFV